MNILSTSNENMTKGTIYALTKSPAVKRMSDVSEDARIQVTEWCKYEEASFKEPDTINTILSVRDGITGNVFATNSATFIKAFDEIVDIFGADGFTVTVMHGTSNSGRAFITAVYVEE